MTGLTAVSTARYGGSTGSTLLINHARSVSAANPTDTYYGTDGVNWTLTNAGSPTSTTGSPFLYWSGPGGYAFGGQTSSGQLLTTTNGSTYAKFPYSVSWRGAASNGSAWIAFQSGSTTAYFRSTAPGTTWNSATLPSAITASIGTAWNGNVFCVLASSTASAYTSPDGSTGSWTARTLPVSAAWTSVVSCGSTLLALSNSTTAYQSDDDGATWNRITLPSAAAYGGSWKGKFYLWSSTAGSSTIVIGDPGGAGGSSKALTFSVGEAASQSGSVNRNRGVRPSILSATQYTVGGNRNRGVRPSILSATQYTVGGNRNLLTFTEDFRSTAQVQSTRPWLLADAVEVQVVYPAQSATFGGMPVSRVQSSTGNPNASLGVSSSFATLANRPYTASFFAKADQCHALSIIMTDKSGGYAQVWFDLLNGTTDVNEVFPSTVDLHGYGIASAGGGWYRCWVSLNSNVGAGDVSAMALLWNDSLDAWFQATAAGDGLWLTGAQLEQGALTPYQARLNTAAGLDTVLRSRTAVLPLAQSQIVTGPMARARGVSVPVVQSETITAAMSRARKAVMSLAEAFSYSVALSKLGSEKAIALAIAETVAHAASAVRNRRTAWTVNETELLTEVLRAARALQVTVPEVSTLVPAVRRTRPVAASVAEAQVISNSIGRTRSAGLAIAEVQSVGVAISRLRRAAIAVAEAFSYSFTLNGQGVKQLALAVNELLAHGVQVVRARRTALTVAEAESLSLLVKAARALQQTITQSEAASLTVRRARTAAMNIAELESITITATRLKLMSYVIAQTESNAFWMNRSRRAVVTMNTLETVQASFNRARAFVVPISETQATVANFGRLRKQALSINETQGTSAAVRRVRTLLQSIANSTGYTFSVSTYSGGEPSVLNVLVTWQEWQASANGVLALVNRSETLSLPMKQAETLTLESDKTAVLIVPANSL